jgi:HEAT repeat protein
MVRANAIEVVAAARQVRLMPKVQRLLRDDFVPVRFASALAVGDMEYNLAESSLRQLLEDEDQNVKIAAAYALTRIGASQGLEAICQAITSSDQNVRANAALLLGKSGDKSSLKWLWWTLQHKDSDYKARFNAAEAIARLGDERIYPKLWSMLISAYADGRVVGVRAMGALGTAEAKNALITMLDDDILEVRLAAAEQLGTHGDTSGEPVVLDVFEKNQTAGFDKENLERINVLTAIAIGEVGSASLTKFLPRLLENESEFVRIAAAKAVLRRTMKK